MKESAITTKEKFRESQNNMINEQINYGFPIKISNYTVQQSSRDFLLFTRTNNVLLRIQMALSSIGL